MAKCSAKNSAATWSVGLSGQPARGAVGSGEAIRAADRSACTALAVVCETNRPRSPEANIVGTGIGLVGSRRPTGWPVRVQPGRAARPCPGPGRRSGPCWPDQARCRTRMSRKAWPPRRDSTRSGSQGKPRGMYHERSPVAGDQGQGGTPRVRNGQCGQRGHPPRIAAGHVPRQGRAPVVPGQVEPFRSGRVGQGEHVRCQLGVPVRGPGGWPGPGGVAAQVGRQDPVTAPGERGRHPVPAAAVLRKAMQQDGDAFRPVPAGVGDLKAERPAGKALHAIIFLPGPCDRGPWRRD